MERGSAARVDMASVSGSLGKDAKLFFWKICHKEDDFVFVKQRTTEILSLFGRDWLHHLSIRVADKDEPCSVNFVVICKQFLCFVKVAAGAVHAPIPLAAALQQCQITNTAGVNLSEHTKSPFLSDACPRKRH